MTLDPAWSPDGSRVAFSSHHDRDDWEIYVMNADGTGLTRLTESVADDRSPGWSPDGLTIVFESDRDGDWEIYVIDVPGLSNGLMR